MSVTFGITFINILTCLRKINMSMHMLPVLHLHVFALEDELDIDEDPILGEENQSHLSWKHSLANTSMIFNVEWGALDCSCGADAGCTWDAFDISYYSC